MKYRKSNFSLSQYIVELNRCELKEATSTTIIHFWVWLLAINDSTWNICFRHFLFSLFYYSLSRVCLPTLLHLKYTYNSISMMSDTFVNNYFLDPNLMKILSLSLNQRWLWAWWCISCFLLSKFSSFIMMIFLN